MSRCLLRVMGQLEEAKPLYEEAMQARREALGDGHSQVSIYKQAALLKKQGKLGQAIALFTEELEGFMSLHGMKHAETHDSAQRLVKLLRDSGQHAEAHALAATHDILDADASQYDELDDKDYHFNLPTEEIDEYEDARASKPTDKCAARSNMHRL